MSPWPHRVRYSVLLAPTDVRRPTGREHRASAIPLARTESPETSRSVGISPETVVSARQRMPLLQIARYSLLARWRRAQALTMRRCFHGHRSRQQFLSPETPRSALYRLLRARGGRAGLPAASDRAAGTGECY